MAKADALTALAILMLAITTDSARPSPAAAHAGDVHLTVHPSCLAVTDENPSDSHDKTFRLENDCGADIVVTDLATPDPLEDGLSIEPRRIIIKKKGSNKLIEFRNKGWARLHSKEIDEVGRDCTEIIPHRDDVCGKFLLPESSYLQIAWDKWSVKGFINDQNHKTVTIQVSVEPETFN